MAARPDPLPRLSVANDMELTVLDLGVEFSYTIPSFSVFSVKLRQCTVQFEARDARVLVYDCFIRSDPFLDTVTPPFCVKLTRHCFVPVEEFCKNVYVRHLRAVDDLGLLIVWEWDTVQGDAGDDVTSSPSTSTSGSESNLSSSGISDNETRTETTVAFKCIGVTREPLIQSLLQEIRDRLETREHVSVRLNAEPTNPFDARAICFQCYHGSSWQTIGYVVREIVEDVHAAMDDGSITSVEFAWVKYKLWKRAPGFYTAINVTRQGDWSQAVKKACSTFY